MTDDPYASYNQGYQDWSGTTKQSQWLSSPGSALDDFWNGLKSRGYRPMNYTAINQQAKAEGPRPGETSGSYRPPGAVGAAGVGYGPPARFNVNLLGDGNPILGLAQGPVGVFAGLSPGAQRGGTQDVGPIPVATTPVTFGNFATYAREGALSVITSALGHHYQQPDTPYAQAAGPVNNENLLENASQGDFEGMLDNVIDGVNVIGDVVNAPFVAFGNFMRQNAANSRADAVRDLVRSGSTIGDPIVRLSTIVHGFDQSQFDWSAIARKAVARGISVEQMAAEMWDLDPAIVQQITDNPEIDDNALHSLVKDQPFSYDPGVNLIAELGVTLGPMLAGGWALRGAAGAIKGVGILGRAAESGFSLEKLGLLGRPVATAERLGSWSLMKAWRTLHWRPVSVPVVGGLGPADLAGLTTKGIAIGAGIRFGEWALKQTAAIAGNQEAVHAVDQWLWEMPLSNNPGLNLVDAFSVHPLRAKEAVGNARRENTVVKVFGKSAVIEHSPITTKNLASVAAMDLPTMHERLLNKLEWDLPSLERALNPDSPTKLTVTDLKNGLLYIAAQVVRARHETADRYMAPDLGVIDRSEAWWREHGAEASDLVRRNLAGTDDSIAAAIHDEFWTRSELVDASELGREGGIGPYIGTIAMQRFLGWLKASKDFAGMAEEAMVPALREDINLDYVTSFRQHLAASYGPNERVSARDLNALQTYVPAAAKLDIGGSTPFPLAGRRTVPRISRRQMEVILDRLQAKAEQADAADTQPHTATVPVLDPVDEANEKAIALAFRVRQDTVRQLEDATAGTEPTGPLPAELEKVLMKILPGVQESHIRADPGAYWPQAIEWYGRMKASALARGDAQQTLDRMGRWLDARTKEGSVDVDALRRVRDAIARPYSAEEIKANPLLEAVVAQRDEELASFVDRATAWLDSPLRKMSVTQLPDGTVMLDSATFRSADLAVINAAIEKFSKADVNVTPAVDSMILSPEVHPLEKVGALLEAEGAGLNLTGVQVDVLTRLGDLTDTYGAQIAEAYGPETPVTATTVAKLTNDVADSQDELTGIREQMRGLAGLIDRGPSSQLSEDLTGFYERARALGSTTVGAGKVEIPHWNNLPIEPGGVLEATNEKARAQLIAAADREVAGKAAVADEFRRLSERATGAIGRKLTADDYTWDLSKPLASHPTRKMALAEAESFRTAGIAVRVERVRSRWQIQRGELTPEAVARLEAERPAPPAVPEPSPPSTAATPTVEPAPFIERDGGGYHAPRAYAPEPGFVYHVTRRKVADVVATDGVEPRATAGNLAGEKRSWWSDGSRDLVGRYAQTPDAVILRTREGETFTPGHGADDVRTRQQTAQVPPDQIEYLGADEAWHPVADLAQREEQPVAPVDAQPPQDEHAAATERLDAIRSKMIARNAGDVTDAMKAEEKAAYAEYVRTKPQTAQEAPGAAPAPEVAPEATPDPAARLAALQGEIDTARAEVERRQAADERFGIATVGDEVLHEHGALTAEAWDRNTPPGTVLEEAQRADDLHAAGADADLAYNASGYNRAKEAGKGPAGPMDYLERFDFRVAHEDAGAIGGRAVFRAHDALIQSGVRPEWVAIHHRLGAQLYHVRWEGDTAIPDPIGAQNVNSWHMNPIDNGYSQQRIVPLTRSMLEYVRAEAAKYKKEGHSHLTPPEGTIKKAEAWLSSAEAEQLRTTPYEPTGTPYYRNRIEADRAAPPPPPPVVEQIGEQAKAAAQESDAFSAAETERQQAFAQQAEHYQQARVEPTSPATAPVAPSSSATPNALGWIKGTQATVRPSTIVGRDIPPQGGEPIVIDGTKYRIRAIEDSPAGQVFTIAEAGPNWKRSRTTQRIGGHGETLTWEPGPALWRLTTENMAPEFPDASPPAEPVQQRFGEAGAAAITPRGNVTFLDPADNRTPIAARVVLVDASDILTSDQIGFPANLQPRSRTVRASSDAQIAAYARDLQPDKLMGTTEGASGMPVVTSEGAVLAGNGRTQAIRLAGDDGYARYKARIVAEAPAYGFDVRQIDAMDRPMLVRELVDVDPVTQTRLAWQLNEMPIGDLAPSLAGAITREDIRLLKIGEEQSLTDAIRSPANTGAVARIVGHLPLDAQSRYFDPASGLNDPGARLVEGAILSKVLRADDRTLPGFERARAVVFDAVEQGGEDMRRITNGLAESAGQIIKAQERAEAGTVSPEILRFSDDLSPALGRILELRRSLGEGQTLDMKGVALLLDNVTMFDEAAINPLQTHIAQVLALSESQKEVRTFLRAVARAADSGDEGVMPMFEDVRQDYTGILNDGIRAWNKLREEGGKSQLDPFPNENYPYDVPLTSGEANVEGTTTPPVVASQPLAAEEVSPAIAARTMGAPVHATAQTIEELPEGQSFTLTDPNEHALAEAIAADPEGMTTDLVDAVETAYAYIERTSANGPGLAGYFDAMRDAANEGTIEPADWWVYRQLAGGLIRKNEQGRYNMALNVPGDADMSWRSTIEAQIAELVDKVRGRTGEKPEGASVVMGQHPQAPIDEASLAAAAGQDVPFDVTSPEAEALAATTEHVITTNESPVTDRAVRKAMGAVVAPSSARRIVEFNAPDATVQAERLSALRQQAEAALEAAQARRRDVENAPIEPTEVQSVFPDDHTRELWDRLMRSGVDQIAAAMGSSEPRSLASLADAVESIDRGLYVDPRPGGTGLTEPEAAELRSYLLRVMNGTLETAIGRRAGRKVDRFAARVKPPADFNRDELQERAKAIMDQARARVVRDPNAAPLDGWEGTQYVPSPLPTKSKAAPDTPLSPRLMFRDAFADDVIPGLYDELRTGRMETVARRVQTSRASRTIDAVMGPRPEKVIRAQAIENFAQQVRRVADVEALAPAEAKKVEQVVEVAFEKWRDHIENTKIIGYQTYRRISLMGPEQMNRLFAQAVDEVYAGKTPTWAADMANAGESAAKMWRRADNRLRNWIRESGMPMSSAIEALYGHAADLGERPGRGITVMYHVMRFFGDLRWLGLEAVEPGIIALSRGGVRPFLEGNRLTAGKVKGSEPIGLGKAGQGAMWREFAHWASTMSDTAQGGGIRMRYLMRTLAHDQRRPFRDAVLNMAQKEPELAKLIREQGDNADQYVARLDRDWALAEQGTRRFATQGEAERAFKPWLDGGYIDRATFDEFVKGRSYTGHPAIEAEIAKNVGNPLAQALYTRLSVINQELFHDLTEVFFGQSNRSNLQRLANHPFLYWPISYQIKATKWLLRFMLDNSFGVDTGAASGVMIQRVWDAQRQRIATDPEYARRLQANNTLFFIAGMLLPITPTDIGVSLSPWLRMIADPEYRRQGGVFGWGPFYTYGNLIPRLVAEQTKPGGLLEGAPFADRIQQAFPQQITVGGPKRPTSTIDAESIRIAGPNPSVAPVDNTTYGQGRAP